MSTERRSTEVDGRAAVTVAARDREPWSRCELAPHALEITIAKPSSPYHGLSFTPDEWAAFLADAKAGTFDLAESEPEAAPQLEHQAEPEPQCCDHSAVVLPTGRGLTDLTARHLAHNCVSSSCLRCHGEMYVDWAQGEWVHADGWTRADRECTPWVDPWPFYLRHWRNRGLPKGQCCYLIHFDRPYKHATHLLEWSQNLERRLAHHANGTGANLMRVIGEAGIGWELARVWEGGTRQTELKLKRQGGKSRMCPLCGIGTKGRKIK
jgi:hypothetical protein